MTVAQLPHIQPGCDRIRSTALWYVSQGKSELRSNFLPAVRVGEAVVRALWSGISRGTERLVAEGLVDASHADRMRAPMQEGDFPYPVKYGYCVVGIVESGPDHLAGTTVFALHPHQDRFVAPVSMLVPVPDGVPARRATLAANMETALNGLWDSGAGPGDTIVVVGGGIVGLLVAYLAAAIPGTEVTVIDPNASRRAAASLFGARFGTRPTATHEAYIVFHCSAS